MLFFFRTIFSIWFVVLCVHACEKYIEREEKRHGIPSRLLLAVALAESGKYDQKLKKFKFYPYSINVQGRGQYLRSKKQALKETIRARKSGITSIDVGCMQLNTYYHLSAFRSLEEAFDIRSNIAYGAKLLSSHQKNIGNWEEAVARYHSRITARGIIYRKKVFDIWAKLTGKLSKVVCVGERIY